MKKSEQLLLLIDDGVPPKVALSSLGIDENTIPEEMLKTLDQRHAATQAALFRSLFKTTQRSSANPSAVAAAAQAWIKLSEKGSSRKQAIKIEITGEDDV